mmetsp:Transcript_4437/g.6491  ORF Transcript_4437/g.6491 Transcript_4437/m.6491 type:complete len:96 (-) Transcript_4437:189-476(-)
MASAVSWLVSPRTSNESDAARLATKVGEGLSAQDSCHTKDMTTSFEIIVDASENAVKPALGVTWPYQVPRVELYRFQQVCITILFHLEIVRALHN